MKKNLSGFILSLVVSILPTLVIAGNAVRKGNKDTILKTEATQWVQNNKGLRFLENKGQMADMQRKPVNSLLFKASQGNADMYVTTSGLSYVFTNFERPKKTRQEPFRNKFNNTRFPDSISVQYCRADMELVGANIRKENIVKENESQDYDNFYLGGICPQGLMNIHNYGRITIKNVYPGIDWVLYINTVRDGQTAFGLKYNFLVHPGANASVIKLKYKWTDKPQLQSNGSLKINSPLGSITEGTPNSYIEGSASNIQTSYVVKDDEVSFKIDTYNKDETLTIDPSLIWATYYGDPGGSAGDDVFSMSDDSLNVWVTGQTVSVNFPTLNPGGGAYFQSRTWAFISGFILKFNVMGVLKWATYCGGTNQDVAQSIYSDRTNVWLTGWSSSSDFPILNPGGGAYYQTNGGVFILRFDTSGVLKWGTHYGGSGTEQGNCIYSDGTNVWVTGFTTSTNFPTLNPGGAYYQSAIAGHKDPFILKFDTSGVLKWATYYGSPLSFSDYGASICSNGNYVWVTGVVDSKSFPTLNPGGGAYFQATPGIENLFILQFTESGVRKWATYYGGNNTDDASSISSDKTHVWVTGWATSSNFPTLNPGTGAYYQGSLGNTYGNAFILKFDTLGVLDWSTYFGGSGNILSQFGDYGTSIQSDGNNIWLSGATGSSNFPTLNPGGNSFFQGTIGAGKARQDIFISQFDTAGICKWSTYCGIDTEQDGSYICSDRANVFVSSDAHVSVNTSYPLSNPGGGAYYHTTIDSRENVIMTKFCIAPACLCTSTFITISATKTSICKGDSLTISAAPVGSQSVKYIWAPGGQTTSSIHVSPTISTVYTVTVNDSVAGCLHYDSVTITVDSITSVSISASPPTICKGDSTILTVSGGATYLWSTGATTSSINLKPLTTNTYTVEISNGACVRDTSVKVSVNSLPLVTLSGNDSICIGDSTTVIASGGTTYSWSTGATTSSITVKPLSNSTYTLQVSNGTCIKDTLFKVVVNPLPAITIAGNDTVCKGYNAFIKAKGGIRYKWSTGATIDSIDVTPASTTTYSVQVNNGTCIKDTTFTIVVNPLPAVTLTGNDSICVGDNAFIKAGGGISYKWSTGATIDSIYVSPASTTAYSVQVNNGTCIKDTTFTIVVNPLPIVTFTGNTSICVGDNAFIKVQGGISYKWSTGATTDSIYVTPASTTTYSVQVYNGTCLKDTTYTVTVNVNPVPSINNDTIACAGSPIQLNAGGGGTYMWAPIGGLSCTSCPNPIANPVGTTTYTVTVSNGKCTAKDSITLTIELVLGDVVCCDTTIQNGETVNLNVIPGSAGETYLWLPSAGLSCTTCASPAAAPTASTTYYVIITNSLGCSIKDSVFIEVSQHCEVFIPDAFSPNKDGQNDVLYVHGLCINTMDFAIYDRWGNKVFESENINSGWDGTNKGQPMNTGTYVYYFKALLLDGSTISKHGNISLIR